MDRRFTLRMTLEDPLGKSYSVAMPIDAFTAMDSYVGLKPPSVFDGRNLNETVAIMRKREFRKDVFAKEAARLAKLLGERMEDEEGWHGVDRQETYEKMRKEGRW